MHYTIDDKPTMMQYETFDKIISFCWEFHSLPEDLNLDIEFDNDLELPYHGYGDIEENVAVIAINSCISSNDMIKTVIHEIVHIKQIYNGELLLGEDKKLSTWYGNVYDVNYHELPWEVEAYEMENKIMEMLNVY
jgi:hypothetical protein